MEGVHMSKPVRFKFVLFSRYHAALLLSFSILCLIFAANLAEAQIKIPKDKIKIPVKWSQLPDIEKLLQEEPPVSTTLDDAIYDIPFLDDYDPRQGAFMTFLPVSPDADFPLLPGLWEGTFQSYCLRAGTYAPGEGDGYAYAPLKGKQADIVSSILKNSVFYPEIDQRDIQLLLWAIIARSKISECGPELQKTAKALMTPKEYDRINGGAIGKIPEPVMKAALEKMPSLAKDIFLAEARLREMLTGVVPASYHEVESVAVRVGEILPPPDSREINSGRWSYDPDGFFIRFFPYSYHRTRIQIYFPEEFNIETDSRGLITSISDRQGLKVQVVYDENIEPLLFEGDDNVVGVAFKELILSEGGADDASIYLIIKNTGWVLTGIPADGGKPASTLTRFSDAADRYKFAVNHRHEVLELKNKLAKANPEIKLLPDTAAANVIKIGNYCEAIRRAIYGSSERGQSDPNDPGTIFTGLLYRLWMKEMAILASGELGSQASGPASVTEVILRGAKGPNTGLLFPYPVFNLFFHESMVGDRLAGESGTYLTTLEPARNVLIQQWRPRPPKPKLPKFKPDKKVAQPGNTGKQRLGQSGRKSGSGNGREAAENTRKVIRWFSRGTSAGSYAIGKMVGPGAATPYGIPKALSGYIVGRTVGYWGHCIDATSMDPPRSDYTILARPEYGTFIPIQAGSGVTRARAQAINAYLAAAVDLTAKIRAARFSVERYSGAMIAGDEEWAKRQLENAIRYERESGLSMLVVADRLEALVKVCISEKVPDTQITPELLNSYLDSLRREGFSAEELEACRMLNLTEEEIEEMRTDLLSDEPMEGPSSIYKLYLEMARALREFARLLLALPVV